MIDSEITEEMTTEKMNIEVAEEITIVDLLEETKESLTDTQKKAVTMKEKMKKEEAKIDLRDIETMIETKATEEEEDIPATVDDFRSIF